MHDERGSVNVNFEIADVARPLVAVGELQRRVMTVVMGPRASFATEGRVEKPTGRSLELEHSSAANWMRLTRGEKRHGGSGADAGAGDSNAGDESHERALVN